MKILRINKHGYVKGGVERGLFDLYEIFKKHGHQTVVLTTKHPKNLPFLDQRYFVEYFDLSQREGFFKDLKKLFKIFWNREAAKKLKKLIQEQKPDIAHLHLIFSHLAPSVVFAFKKYQIPVVMTLHNYKLFCPNRQFFTQGRICYECLNKRSYWPCVKNRCIHDSLSQSVVGALEMFWNNRILNIEKHIDAFIVGSRFVKQKALEFGIAEKKMHYLPYSYSAVRNKRFTGRGVNQDNPYFIYLGRLSREKGVGDLIQAFDKISGQLPGWQLKIIGDGPERKNLEKLAKDNKKIEFLGWIKEKEKLDGIISASCSMVVPSVWQEVFGRIVLESFALEKPVIISRVGGMQELVQDKETGLLFKAGDVNELAEKMLWLAKNGQEAEKMGQKAKQVLLKKHNPETRYQKLLAIYEKLKS